eukprot:GEMP01070144.1.p1 GENE.GEMP01070144.1~~GEMP01070144.1.p1  ORF type:complete len:166 (+),score=33.91 GEMP01070144.1:139-636(+)
MRSFDILHCSADHATDAHRVPSTCFHHNAQAFVDMCPHASDAAVHAAHALPSCARLTRPSSSTFPAGHAAGYARASSFLDARGEGYTSHANSFLDVRTAFKEGESVHLDSSGQPYMASDHDRKTTQLTVAGVMFCLMLSISGYFMFTAMRIPKDEEDEDGPTSSH